MYEKDRQYYRTQVPAGDVAVLRVGPHQMAIREVSERGIRYDPAPDHQPELGAQITGVATFMTIGEIEVSGRLLREQGTSLVIVLDPPGIPHATLVALQQFLMKRYTPRAQG